jgi:hypothetical protein
MLKVLLVVVGVVMLVVGTSMAASFSPDGRISPIFCGAGNAKTVSSNGLTAFTSGTAFSANPARLDGYVVNASSNYLYCSFTSTSPTTSNGFLLYPAGSTSGASGFYLKHETNVYTGAMYFCGYETDLTTRGASKMSFYEWK